MAKEWTYRYDSNVIRVINRYNGSMLLVNDELKDENRGISLCDKLSCTLPDGKLIRATLEGVLQIECQLFVENSLLQPEEIKKLAD